MQQGTDHFLQRRCPGLVVVETFFIHVVELRQFKLNGLDAEFRGLP